MAPLAAPIGAKRLPYGAPLPPEVYKIQVRSFIYYGIARNKQWAPLEMQEES